MTAGMATNLLCRWVGLNPVLTGTPLTWQLALLIFVCSIFMTFTGFVLWIIPIYQSRVSNSYEWYSVS